MIGFPLPYRHRADVDRNVETGLDPGRNPLPPRYERNVSDMPCTYWATTERRVEGPEFNATIEDPHLVVAPGAEIEVGDVVAEIRDRRGRVLATGLRVQTDVRRIPTHRELVLQQVGGTYTPEVPASGS